MGATSGTGHGARACRPGVRFTIRVPVSLRKELAARARAEGVSLNALVLAYLAHGLSSPWGQPPASKD